MIEKSICITREQAQWLQIKLLNDGEHAALVIRRLIEREIKSERKAS